MPPTSDLTTDEFVAETLQLAVELKEHAKEASKEIARLAKPAGTSNQLEKTDEGFEQIQEVVDMPESMLLQLRQVNENAVAAMKMMDLPSWIAKKALTAKTKEVGIHKTTEGCMILRNEASPPAAVSQILTIPSFTTDELLDHPIKEVVIRAYCCEDAAKALLKGSFEIENICENDKCIAYKHLILKVPEGTRELPDCCDCLLKRRDHCRCTEGHVEQGCVSRYSKVDNNDSEEGL